MDLKLVNEAAARNNGLLRDAGLAIVAHLIFEAVPVDGGRFGEMVVEDDAHVIALVDLDGWAGRGAVEAPEVERPVGQDGLLHRLGDEMKDLGAVLESEGQVGDIGRGDRDVAGCAAAGASQFKNGAGGAGVRAAAGGFIGEELRCGDQAGTEAKRALEKAASITHGEFPVS